jgi:GNAT superfamily N-acetyltransferase
LKLPETWDAYVEQLSKQHRNRLRRTKREMFDSGSAVLRRVTNPTDLVRGFEILQRLHQMRRNSVGDAGCFADPRFEKFLLEATRRFLEQGTLRLQWTEVDGEPVAFDLGCVDGNGVFVYQTGFDPAKSDLSPGRLHFQASIMKAIEEGHPFFDFLRGDEPYKAHFRAAPISVLETRLIGPRIVPRLGHRLWKLQKRAKARVRTLLEKRASRSNGTSKVEESTKVIRNDQSLTKSGRVATLVQRLTQRPLADHAARKTPLYAFGEARSRFGAGSALRGLAYRAARRVCGLEIGHVLSLELADLPSTLSPSVGFEYRGLTADDVRMLAADPANDLAASLATRLENGVNYCFAVFDGPRLASYSWYALDSIEPEHSLDTGLSFPKNTVYLYKAYTHPDYRGQRVHHITLHHAVRFFAQRGISRLITLVEYGNWASLLSHERFGCRRAGRIVKFGCQPLRVESYPRLAETWGIRFGGT